MLGATRSGVNQGQKIRLQIQYLDQGEKPVDPSIAPSVSIIDPNNNIILNVNMSSGVLRQDVGLYYYDYLVPVNATIGSWHDIWTTTVSATAFSKTLSFLVDMAPAPVMAEAGQELDPDLSPEAIKNVMHLLKLLKAKLGSDGVRRKRDQFGRDILDAHGNPILEPCNVFDTEALYKFLRASLSEFNSVPHFTNFRFHDTAFVHMFENILTEGAFIMALAMQGLLEKGREFNMTDDGLTYQPPLIADYIKGYLTDFMQRYQERLKFIKCNMKPEPRGFGSAYSFASGGASPAFKRLRHLRERQII